MSIKSEKIEILPCTSSPNVFDKSMINRKIEVDVELWSDHYIVVSCFIGDHEFHGILLKAQKNVHSPFDVDSKKFDEWKSLVSNNFQNWDSDKMSSLCLRQTCFDESKFDSFKIRQSHGIRRLDSRPVRLRPVASQRSTVLCARCQQQRVAIVPSRNSQYNNSPNNHAANKRSKQENFSNAINSETKKRLKAKKANAQLIFERLFAKKQEDSKLQQMSTLNSQQMVVAGQQPQPQQSQLPQTPPPPPAPPRVPTLKITFGKSDAKTVTVINGRPPASSTSAIVSSSRSHHSNQEDKSAVKVDPVESAVACASSSVIQNGLHGGHLPIGMSVGDIVWAKMPSYPYWPAKIFDVYETHACVTWCGSTQYGYVDVSVLEPFVKCFNKRYNAKRTSGSYQKAVADAVRQFKEIAENAYYVSLLSPACRKYVQKFKNRAETEKKHVKPVDNPAKKSSARQSNVRSTDSDDVRREIKSTLQPMPPLALAVKRPIPKTSPLIAMPLEMPPLKRAAKETTPVARASPETPPVMEVDSEPESPDASPRLVIDELVEESFENFAKRSRLSADFDDPVQQSDTTPSASPQGTLSSSTAAPMTSNGQGQGNEMDFDSVLSELQEMNDMCAAGSNSLLTSC